MSEHAEHSSRKARAQRSAQESGAPKRAGGATAAGNAAVGQLVQRRMQVGAADDPAEAEADRVASTVLRRLDGEGGARPATGVGAGEAVRRKADPEATGLEGGPLDASVQRRIESAKGGGDPLDGQTKGRMESAFGRSFDQVRVHTGGEADTLNRSMNAEAFTTGQDVFFSQGAYAPGTSSGDGLLAHELAHTVQQGGDTAQRSPVRRLTVQGTQWGNAQTNQTKFSKGSGVGVAFITDGGKPVVVKYDAHFSGEIVVATSLMNAVMGSDKGREDEDDSDITASSPDVRIASAGEAATVQQIITNRQGQLADGDPEKVTAGKMLGEANKGAALLVYDLAKGQEVEELLKTEKQSKKSGIRRRRKLREDSFVSQLVSDPGLMQTMGRGAAVDVATGNGDRVLSMFNPKNFRFGDGQVQFIDNVQSWDASDVSGVMGRMMNTADVGEQGFNFWASLSSVKRTLNGDYAGIASDAWDEMERGIIGLVRAEDTTTVTNELAKAGANMQASFVKGMKGGVNAVVDAIMRNADRFVQGLPQDQQLRAATNLIVRAFALQGGGTDYNYLFEYAEHLAAVKLGIMLDA